MSPFPFHSQVTQNFFGRHSFYSILISEFQCPVSQGRPQASGVLEFSDAENLIAGKVPLPTVMGDVYGAVRDKGRFLFLFDNAGEIGFDSFLIEQLKAMGSQDA